MGVTIKLQIQRSGTKPLVVEEAAQRVHLHEGHGEHDQKVGAGPEGHAPQIVLQQVSVTSLEHPQCRLCLATALQMLVHRFHLFLWEREREQLDLVK